MSFADSIAVVPLPETPAARAMQSSVAVETLGDAATMAGEDDGVGAGAGAGAGGGEEGGADAHATVIATTTTVSVQ